MVRLLLRFSEDIVSEPITAQTILDEGVAMNILSARVNAKQGEILVDVPAKEVDKIVKAFQRKGVKVLTPKQIQINNELCIECGACISLCPVKVISIESDNTVNFNVEKCLGRTCGLCIDACPMNAIDLIQ
jgi:formate hydrogenlyase subunit 6/NADH:ubiquinone oxidoreductase subunit I